MDRAEAIKVLSEWVATGANGDKSCTVSLGVNIDTIDSVFNMAIAALREQEQKRYTTHEVAVILAEFAEVSDVCKRCHSYGGRINPRMVLLDYWKRIVGVSVEKEGTDG